MRISNKEAQEILNKETRAVFGITNWGGIELKQVDGVTVEGVCFGATPFRVKLQSDHDGDYFFDYRKMRFHLNDFMRV